MKNYIDPEKLDQIKKLSGQRPAKYTTYYNLGGPEKDMAVGRIDGEDVFVVEMDRTGYDSIIQKNPDPKRAYSTLYHLYTISEGLGDEVVSPEEIKKFASIFKKYGGEVIQQTGRKGDSVVVEFPAAKEAIAKEISKKLSAGAKGRFETVYRKEGGKIFITFRANKR